MDDVTMKATENKVGGANEEASLRDNVLDVENYYLNKSKEIFNRKVGGNHRKSYPKPKLYSSKVLERSLGSVAIP
ncbi:hypothetical protein RJT34_27625 [Clitoria ternatea]|uniref:Uncharacterized protein n=1 Tax=Clitoria ternatea TaxID=43366 RepID=A0AAN9FCF9_CLITE